MEPASKLMKPVASLDELARRGHVVVAGADRPVVCFYNGGDVRAVDNRCPHMGFPLSQGSCEDGVITCPWHNARFEADSGCTFDLFAGDVEPYDVEVRNGQVYLSTEPRPRDTLAYAWQKLREGMETNNSLVIAKALLLLTGCGTSSVEVARVAALFGAEMRDSWGPGLTGMTALLRLDRYAAEKTRYLALYQGVRRVAADCQNQTPRRRRFPLSTERVNFEQLSIWMQQWVRVRHRDAAERTLLTALDKGLSRQEKELLIFQSCTQRIYADASHLTDFSNKSFELLDLIGWEHASQILPSLVAQLVSARGGEEQSSWHQPVDLVAMLQAAQDEVPGWLASGAGKIWQKEVGSARELQFAEIIATSGPVTIIKTCGLELQGGATIEQLAKSVAYAAALRLARFGSSNELGDWTTAAHTFSYCHAIHQVVRRSPAPELVPGILHGALSVYLDRFLNVPPERVSADRSDLPADDRELLADFIAAFDHRSTDDRAARLTLKYLESGYDTAALADAFITAITREDADFHLIQVLEAAISESEIWGHGPESHIFWVATARYFAAMAPTQRSQYQTAQIAWRLHRGEKVFEGG